MKRKILTILTIFILIIVIFNLYNFIKIKNLDSTKLNNIYIENMTIGCLFNNDLDKDIYNERNDITDKSYNYHFDELSIAINNGVVTKIRGYNNYSNIIINDKDTFKNIFDIQEILGNNYIKKWFDKEQGLSSNVYIDKDNKIKATFIFSYQNNELIWIILERN